MGKKLHVKLVYHAGGPGVFMYQGTDFFFEVLNPVLYFLLNFRGHAECHGRSAVGFIFQGQERFLTNFQGLQLVLFYNFILG